MVYQQAPACTNHTDIKKEVAPMKACVLFAIRLMRAVRFV